ncbi:Nn.00g002090.m01.CDS01 [Neocucurbitaria sp. VM-36]
MGVLSKFTIAVAGNLPHDPAQIKKWVLANGGNWSTRVSKDVTHLITSKDAWKVAIEPVQQASDMGIWIVSYDWFEDSLQSKRKLSEKKYTMEQLGKERKKRKQLKRLGAMVDGKKFHEGCEMARVLTGSGTSKTVLVKRKPKKSTSVFFSASIVPDTPFVSSTEDLRRRRVEREAALAAENMESQDEAEEGCSSQASPSSNSTISLPTASAETASKKTKSPLPPLKTTVTNPAPAAESQAKSPHIKDLYHYFLDTTGFEYKIVLARSDFSSCSFARYHIGLLESHTKPHTYCTVVQYTPPAKKAPESVSDVPSISGTGLRRLLSNFLDKHDDPVAQQHQANKNSDGSARLSEAARLQSLVTKPAPVSESPYKALICPMNSTFPSAWRAFRHAFRDLTLLTWEERFDTNRAIQKARAKQLNIEPFLYSKPAKGMPVGLLPQEAGLLQGADSDEEYVRNAYNLPSISHLLSKNGAIGNLIHREAEERKRKEEEARIEAEEREERGRKKRGEVAPKGRKPNYNAPMFNGVTGRPQADVYGQYKRNQVVGAGFAGAIKKRKLFPREQE